MSLSAPGPRTFWSRPPRRSGPRRKEQSLPIQADVTLPQDIEKVISTTAERFGRIDILVNNAGHSSAHPFESVTDEEWQADFDLKLWAAIRFVRSTIPHMRKVGGGRIINVTNLGAKTPGPSSVPTSVTRAAGIAVTKALSKDLAKDNILVNTVCIGLIKSGQNRRRYEEAKAQNPNFTWDEFYEDMVQRRNIPLGRVGEAEEAGDVIAFLASGASKLPHRHRRQHRWRFLTSALVLQRRLG